MVIRNSLRIFVFLLSICSVSYGMKGDISKIISNGSYSDIDLFRKTVCKNLMRQDELSLSYISIIDNNFTEHFVFLIDNCKKSFENKIPSINISAMEYLFKHPNYDLIKIMYEHGYRYGNSKKLYDYVKFRSQTDNEYKKILPLIIQYESLPKDDLLKSFYRTSNIDKKRKKIDRIINLYGVDINRIPKNISSEGINILDVYDFNQDRFFNEGEFKNFDIFKLYLSKYRNDIRFLKTLLIALSLNVDGDELLPQLMMILNMKNFAEFKNAEFQNIHVMQLANKKNPAAMELLSRYYFKSKRNSKHLISSHIEYSGRMKKWRDIYIKRAQNCSLQDFAKHIQELNSKNTQEAQQELGTICWFLSAEGYEKHVKILTKFVDKRILEGVQLSYKQHTTRYTPSQVALLKGYHNIVALLYHVSVKTGYS